MWQGVEFATDASGGPHSRDPRLRVVGWAIVAFRRVGDELGAISGVLGPGSTVPQGESHALQVLLDRAPGGPLLVGRLQTGHPPGRELCLPPCNVPLLALFR